MEVFFPTIEEKMTALVIAFRFVVFAIMVAGLIAYAGSGRAHGDGLLFPLAKAIVVTAVIAYVDRWFPRVEDGFLAAAEFINPGYTENPTAAADEIRESTTTDPGGHEWSWRRLNESVYQAFVSAMANIFVYLGTLLTAPMLILQYILRWLLYLLAPFALATFMVPGFSSIGVRFFQQTLAILAWPVGFAMTNLVALAVWRDFTAAVSSNPETVDDVVFAPLLTIYGAMLATIMLVVGTISTPIVMQALFAHGHAFTGSSANPAIATRWALYLFGGRRRHDRGGDRSSGGAGGHTTSSASAGTRVPLPPPIGAQMRPGI